MTTAIDIPTGVHEFFKAQGSTDAQRADAIAVLKTQCGMVSGVMILRAALTRSLRERRKQSRPPRLERFSPQSGEKPC